MIYLSICPSLSLSTELMQQPWQQWLPFVLWLLLFPFILFVNFFSSICVFLLLCFWLLCIKIGHYSWSHIAPNDITHWNKAEHNEQNNKTMPTDCTWCCYFNWRQTHGHMPNKNLLVCLVKNSFCGHHLSGNCKQNARFLGMNILN